MNICTTVIFLFWDAAKKGFSRFPHIGTIMPFLKIGKFFDSNLYFFQRLKISLENYELFSFNEQENIVQHADIKVLSNRIFTIDHFPLSYIPIWDKVNSIIYTSKFNKMIEVTLWSFSHSHVSKVNYFFKIVLLILVYDNLTIFPWIAECIELLTPSDQGSQFMLDIYR